MAQITVKSNPIVVDREAGDNDGTTMIAYGKESYEVLWLRPPGKGWDQPNLFVLTGEATADTKGTFSITLQPGEIFDIGIYRENQQPIDEQVIQTRALAFLKVFCIWKKPEQRKLITDQNRQSGGTWHWHQVHTNIPTSIVLIGATRKPPLIDGDGVPHLIALDGAPSTVFTFGNDHQVELQPLLPGNHYFFTVMVADLFGNWEVVVEEFDTLRRQFNVQFPTIHIYNDGDPGGDGEGEFWFRVMFAKNPSQPSVIKDFRRPTDDIDDWGETDRPYSVGFAHVGVPLKVNDGEEEVWVASWAIEHDGAFEADEGAGNWGKMLPLPVGQGVENVPSAGFLMDCPSTTTDDDFHYGVDVTWSVSYVP